MLLPQTCYTTDCVSQGTGNDSFVWESPTTNSCGLLCRGWFEAAKQAHTGLYILVGSGKLQATFVICQAILGMLVLLYSLHPYKLDCAAGGPMSASEPTDQTCRIDQRL